MNENPEVTRWFDELEHPLKDLILAVRATFLEADERVSETIKWKSPTYMYGGNLASIDPKAKMHVAVLFHRGAESQATTRSSKARADWRDTPASTISHPLSRAGNSWRQSLAPGATPERSSRTNRSRRAMGHLPDGQPRPRCRTCLGAGSNSSCG